MSASCHNISEPALHHSRTHGKVNHSFLLAVIYACEHSLIRFFLHNLYFLYQLGRDILRGKLRVIKEESLSVNRNFLDCLSIGRNGTVSADFHSRKLLKQLFEHIIVRCLERGCVVLYRIFLHDDRIAHG